LRGFRPVQPVHDVKTSIPYLVRGSFQRHNNLIVRPKAPTGGPALAQLDDLDSNQMQRVSRFSFLMLRTSPGKYQAWLAIRDGDKDLVRRVVKAVGSDPRASGAVRLAGTRNYKRKYEPDFPIVDAFGMWGCCVDSGALQDLGLTPIPDPPWPTSLPQPLEPSTVYSGPRRWPNYWQALSGASAKPEGGPDRSQADFTWCMWAIDRGWSVDQTELELMRVSEKAREQLKRGDKGYARLTAWKASLAVQRNRGGK